MRPSPLWKTLGATEPLFSVDDGTGIDMPTDDTRVTSITIEAGTAMVGLSTARCTVDVMGYQAYLPDNNNLAMKVRLTIPGEILLADITGRERAAIRHRFTGKVVSHDVTDEGKKSRTGAPKYRTTITGQDWASFVSQVDKGGNATFEEPNVWRLYRSLFAKANVPGMLSLQAWGSEWVWPYLGGENNLNVSTADVLGKYTADLGNLIRQDRFGLPTAWSHDHLIALADSWQDVNPDPLQRSQVLSPITWRRAATIPKALAWEQRRTPDLGDTVRSSYRFEPEGDLVTREQPIDMTHVWDNFWTTTRSGFLDIMRARYYRERGTDLSIEDVTVDVLRLLRRGTPADKSMFGQLLTMNHGDPLTLGWDWPEQIRGVHFAEKITHKITPQSWTVTLRLVPARHVTGIPSPADLAGRTWETAYPPVTTWNTPATTWEDSP